MTIAYHLLICVMFSVNRRYRFGDNMIIQVSSRQISIMILVQSFDHFKITQQSSFVFGRNPNGNEHGASDNTRLIDTF